MELCEASAAADPGEASAEVAQLAFPAGLLSAGPRCWPSLVHPELPVSPATDRHGGTLSAPECLAVLDDLDTNTKSPRRWEEQTAQTGDEHTDRQGTSGVRIPKRLAHEEDREEPEDGRRWPVGPTSSAQSPWLGHAIDGQEAIDVPRSTALPEVPGQAATRLTEGRGTEAAVFASRQFVEPERRQFP